MFWSNSEWDIVHFKQTVKMSTYLVAFVISNFESIQKNSSKNVLIEVAGRPEAIRNKEGDYALDEAAQIIDFFADYFNIRYPLDKSSKLLNF